MKKRTLFTILLTATSFTIGLTFSSFAKEVSVMDQNGSWYSVDVLEEINGLEFAEYIDASSTIAYCKESEIPLEWDYYLYDANTLQPVKGGWYIYANRSDVWNNNYKVWMYAVPGTNGSLIRNSWILDDGQVYLTNSYGATRQNETIRFGDLIGVTTDVIYNVQTGTWDALPYTQSNNSHHLTLTYGGVEFDDFIKTISGENYEAWLAEWNRVEAERTNKTVTNLDWSMFDAYVPQAMADRGFYSYEILNKERIENNLYGMAVYKVKVPESGSYSTKYLMVYINADGSYWKSSF